MLTDGDGQLQVVIPSTGCVKWRWQQWPPAQVLLLGDVSAATSASPCLAAGLLLPGPGLLLPPPLWPPLAMAALPAGGLEPSLPEWAALPLRLPRLLELLELVVRIGWLAEAERLAVLIA